MKHSAKSLDFSEFAGVALPDGFFIKSITCQDGDMMDAIGRPALAKTVIEGPAVTISLIPQSIEEQSISIYHEVLEALVVALPSPPESTLEMVESDFEHAAQSAHREIGLASPQNVLVFLYHHGFKT